MTSLIETRRESVRAIHEQITSDVVGEFTIELLSTITPTLACWVKRNIGKESTDREVAGRDKSEDVELKIDKFAEKFIAKVTNKLAGAYGLSFSILSEHNNFEVGEEGTPHLAMVLDPFENSDEYKRGLPTPPFSHFQIYRQKGLYDQKREEPIAAGAANLSTGEMYLAINGANYYFHPEFKKLIPMGKTREVRSIKDGNVAIASYDGKYKYSSLFDESFTQLKRDLSNYEGSFHGKGGSHSYIDLAKGAISAYIMFHEPRGEIDPAYLFALQAGCKIVSVDLETGKYQDYRFNPNLQYERVPFLIAARSEELIIEILNYHKEARLTKEKERQPENV